MPEFQRQESPEEELTFYPNLLKSVAYGGWIDGKHILLLRFEDPLIDSFNVALPAINAADLAGDIARVLAATDDARQAFLNSQTDNN